MISISLFLVEEVVLQICHCFNGHKFYSISVDDATKKNMNLDKARFKNLINFKFKFQYILFYTFHFYQKIKGSEILIDQDTEIKRTQFFYSCLK